MEIAMLIIGLLLGGHQLLHPWMYADQPHQ